MRIAPCVNWRNGERGTLLDCSGKYYDINDFLSEEIKMKPEKPAEKSEPESNGKNG